MIRDMETAILVWVIVGAGITAGAFLLARAVVEIGAVAYAAIERTITRREAVQRGTALAAGAGAALVVTAVIFAIAVLAIFAALLASTFGS
jgi:hypothetical protein